MEVLRSECKCKSPVFSNKTYTYRIKTELKTLTMVEVGINYSQFGGLICKMIRFSPLVLIKKGTVW